MRLCSTHLAVPRTWTVELRPQPRGTLLVCAHCSESRTLQSRAARSEALAHLARHARCSLLPRHLRTCQCHERGCRWHSRHRGCAGPLLLVLSRELGGRKWRLADVCAACAASMKEASVVPDTALPGKTRTQPASQRRPRSSTGKQERELVRDMLSYLAASMPLSASAEARLLALQCALRSGPLGTARIPAGLARGMALGQAASVWLELEATGWLRSLHQDGAVITARLTDPLTAMPGLRTRSRAADWALRVARGRDLIKLGSGSRLVVLALHAHMQPHARGGTADAHQLGRMCACPVPQLLEEVQCLVQLEVFASRTLDPLTEDLSWQLPGPVVTARHS